MHFQASFVVDVHVLLLSCRKELLVVQQLDISDGLLDLNMPPISTLNHNHCTSKNALKQADD